MYTPEEIRSLRQRLGLNLAAFGKLVGVSESTACRWELGASHPRFKMMKRLNELSSSGKNAGEKASLSA